MDLSKKIKDVIILNDNINSLKNQLQAASEPLLDDLSLVDNIYDIFTEMQKDGKINGDSPSIDRCKFIFVVLYLFSPSALAGFRMRPGLRRAITDAVMCQPSLISHNARPIMFYYRKYADFREQTNSLLKKVAEELKINDEIFAM